MLHGFLTQWLDAPHAFAAYALITFVLTAILLHANLPFLPRDQGRAYAVNGEQSKGKVRGVGLVMVIVFVACAALFVPFSLEFMFYALLLIAEMFSGYLDDAAKIPWSDYKKGLIDLIVSVLVGVIFLLNDSPTIFFGANAVALHPVVYGILATVLVWASINAVNCSDGVDGLSGSVGFVSLMSLLLIYPNELTAEYHAYILLFGAVILAYLLFNAGPSKVLMGDAGSRPLGVLLAILAMKSHHPLCWLLCCGVFLFDGITGLVKIFLKRFFKISILKNIRTPLHDEVRKNRGWSDTQVVVRFAAIQVILSIIWYISSL